MYLCGLCDYNIKYSSHLKRHKADKHNIGVTWYKCTLCESKFKQAGALKKHKAYKHDIGVNWYECGICESKFKQAGTLKRHKADAHDIGITWYECDICESKFKQSGNLKQHKAYKHDIGVTWHECDICESKFKQSGNLKQHAQLHDPAYIARQKSKETRLFHFLTKHFNVKREHTISLSCINGTFRRVDFVIYHNQTIFFVECDEFQHNPVCTNYSIQCENRRILDIMSALTIDGNTLPVHIIRFNPDTFKKNNQRQTVSLQERYAILQEYIQSYNSNIPFSIRYFFYDTKNSVPTILNDPEYNPEIKTFVLIQ